MTRPDSDLHESDGRLERLLEQASPRPAPSAESAARAKQAVRDEWQQVVGRRSRWRRFGVASAAAAAVLAVTLVMMLQPAPVPVLTATVDRASGPVYLLGQDGVLNELAYPAEFLTRQTVVTGEEARIGLTWLAGGSLRLDENTELRFVSTEEVELVSGRVYFDSQDPPVGAIQLTISTAHGDVTHIGTRFITETTPERLTVSVRDGSVSVDGHRHQVDAAAGKSVTLRGDARPEQLDIRVYGAYWEWVEAVAPTVELEKMTLEALLEWVRRETGLEFEFENAELRDEAINNELRGFTVTNDMPRETLRQILRLYGLDYDIRDGVIHIRDLAAP